MARWGLLLKLHGTSLEKSNFNPRVCFYGYFCVVLYGPSYTGIFKSGVKKFNDSIKARYDDFSPVSEAVKHSEGL